MLSRLRIGTKIAASFVLGLGLFAAIAVAAYRGTNQLVDSAEAETHTYQVLGELEELTSLVKDAETGQRGYVITGESRYLEPYTAATKRWNQNLEDLRRLTADNPEQQRRLDALEPLLNGKLAELQETIDLRQSQGFDAAQKVVLSDRGKQLMEQIRQVVADLEKEERNLLQQRTGAAQGAAHQTLNTVIYSVPVYSILLGLIGLILARDISRPLENLSSLADKVGDGDFSVSLPPSKRRDEIGVLNNRFNQMTANLREITAKNEEQNWLKSNLAEMSQVLQGQRNLETVARTILSKLAPLVNAQQGVFYWMDVEATPPVLKLLGSYAHQERKHLGNQFHLGEGLVGQCALEKQRILLTDVSNDYIRIGSGLGEAPPLNILVLPVLFEAQVIGVIELASLYRFSQVHLALLTQVSEGIGVVFNTIAADNRTAQLLEEAQTLTEELQAQQDELRTSYRRLEEQAEALRTSEALMKEQQEELQQNNEELQQLNEELEEKAELLAAQKQEVEQKNQEIERARQAIAEKAEQLALSSKYKSEFLANMSHELRTPLNSLLILARLLGDNGEGNLTEKQVEYSQTIYSAGTDLLDLINDILDLAKIESGMMVIDIEPMPFGDLQTYLKRTFQQVAQDRGLEFRVETNDSLPESIATDAKRLQQILKNLLSNAFKFTERGEVTLQIFPTTYALERDQLGGTAVPAVAFAVTDTGIGIPAEKQRIIFEAFQQADGTTSRRFGGTGLGLSISRELAYLLGGSLEVVSQPGQGSTFTLYLPLDGTQGGAQRNGGAGEPAALSAPPPTSSAPAAQQSGDQQPAPSASPAPMLPHPDISDDRQIIQPDDRVLLIIEDDLNFARILRDLVRQQGFKALVSLHGSPGIAMAQAFKPDAVMLDIRLPDMDGWTVLDRLKHDPDTRHIPVHILSVDEGQQRGLQLGAIAYLQKPVSPEALMQALTNIKGFVERPVKHLLIVEDDAVQAQSIIELIGNGDVQSTAVYTGADALEVLRSKWFDCVVLDLGLPDMSGFDLIEQIKQEERLAKLPIIVYTGKELSRQEETQLKRLAETIIVKDVRSPERLLDETTLFLHRVQANLPQPKRQMLEQLRQTDPILANKKVLIIDDDVRNIFALTSLLERYQMEVRYAENGRDGITMLQNHPDVDVVLMDVMMPEMDGYQTTRAIRQQGQFRALPIIALTAKAMQGDREKCLEAGASDYITKPVATEQLLSLLRVWLYGRE